MRTRSLEPFQHGHVVLTNGDVFVYCNWVEKRFSSLPFLSLVCVCDWAKRMCRQERICRVGFLLLNFGDSSLSFELATTEELKTAKTGAVSFADAKPKWNWKCGVVRRNLPACVHYFAVTKPITTKSVRILARTPSKFIQDPVTLLCETIRDDRRWLSWLNPVDVQTK